MEREPDLSIIIVTHGAKEVVRDCLASVARENDGSLEVIVVDNASTDGVPEMITTEFPLVRLIRNDSNVGFSPANNQGLEVARAPMIILLNSDTILHSGVLPLWLKDHQARGATVSGPRLLNTDGSFQPSAWKVPRAWAAVTELFGLHLVLGTGAYSMSLYQSDLEPGFVSGAAMLFSRDLVNTIGGLDPEMFWMEDVDFCVRARKAGGKVMYFHGPAITHVGGQSSKKDLGRVIGNQLVSRIKFIRKQGGVVEQAIVISAIGLHILTRIIAFGVISVFRDEPRAPAYHAAWAKYVRYLLRNDRSI